MLRVALTGGIASGKTAAAAMLRDLGAFVSQSDEVGRAMMQPGQAVYDRIVQRFGAGVVRADGSLDRRELARLAFHKGRLQELNGIVHPAVIAAQAAWLRGVGVEHPAAVAVVESALVLETTFGAAADGTPWRARFDRVVLVTAPEEIRLERFVGRVLSSEPLADRVTVEADARARFAAQMPEAEKRLLVDVVIENDGALDALRELVGRLYVQLHREAEDAAAEAM